MKIQCNTHNLYEVCSTVQRAVSQKSTLPSIEGILMEAKSSKLTLSGYDLEMGITTALDCKVEKEGSAVLNARLFCDILRSLPAERVEIEVDEHNLCRITSGDADFSLIGISADDYPELPSVSGGYTLSVKQSILKEMIRQTIFATSTSDTKLVHKGIRFEVKKGSLRLIAVDGFRLAIRNESINYDGQEISFVVPSKTLSEIMRLSGDEDENIVLNIGKRIVVFEIGGYVLVSRLLEGEFLKYESTIPSSCSTTAILKLRLFTESIERASLVITNKNKSPVRCIFDEDIIKVSSTTAIGTVNDKIPAKIEGKRLEIGFNNIFLLDALKVYNTDEIKIELNSQVSPIIIKPIEGDSFLFLIMPLRLKA
ncbi:MAG: DNA polymerase III subunit beta [Clostridiales bacterium]|jgi:DNA polymerase-3 subunit beta|nr:DNA polymerase III subunit beta [Clostridiales bacterium]